MKKLFYILITLCAFKPASAQQFLSINPNFSNSGQSISTVVTSSAFYYSMGSMPSTQQQDFYMYQGPQIYYPTSIFVQDDDHLLVDWFIPANAPSGNYDVVWMSPLGFEYGSVPGGFNINCVPTPAVISNPLYNYICPSGGSVVLQANTGTGFSHQWYKNSVAISGATLPSYTATTTGSYTVKIVNQQGCPDMSDPVYIFNSSSPSAFINSPSTNVTVCPNSVIGLAANAGSGYSYQWFRNGTALNGATTQIISITDSGSYTVRVTNSSGCFATSAIRKISWYALPSATISTPGNFGFCQGSSVTLSVPSVAGNTYKWYKYGNLIPGANAATLSVNTAGKYKAVVTSSSGCTKTGSPVNISSYPLPQATITATGPTTFCQGDQVKLQANYGSTYNYQWFKYGNAIPGANTRNYFANTNGTYKVEVTTAYGCSKKSTATTVGVMDAPNAIITPDGPTTFCQGGSVLLRANNGNGYTYQWKLYGNDIPGAVNLGYIASVAGNYKVAVTNASGCTTLSANETITIPCRIGNMQSSDEIKVYPNPANSVLFVSGVLPEKYEVVNTAGQICITSDHYLESGIDISMLPPGLYILRFQQEAGWQQARFMKQE